jgi:alkanesulfonate monooxygenase SsuD/methylene tetrahydromethanopterin reductase-like flavin-dependent oxidoreductase (luciferase family)
MRNPFQVAKIVATAAVLSNNRIALGVGAGWMEEEFELLEQPFRQRGKRMDEMLEVMRTLWAGGMVEHHGEFYDFDRLEMSPVPSRPIPVYVGGLSKPALRRAARNDGWLSDLHSTAELKEIVAQLRALREESDRADNPFHVLASATDAFDIDGYRRLEDVGVTHLVTMPWVFYGGRLDSLDSKRDGIRRFGEEIIARA